MESARWAYQKLNPAILMMKSAEDRLSSELAQPMARRILTQGQKRSEFVVPPAMRLVSGPKLDITVKSLGVGIARRADPGRTGPLGIAVDCCLADPKSSAEDADTYCIAIEISQLLRRTSPILLAFVLSVNSVGPAPD